MDHASSQMPMSGSHRSSVPTNSLPPEYWSTLDALYTGPDPQHQQQQQQQQPIQRQQQPTPSQQPLGIGWDHPVFQQQQQNQIPRQQESNHGIYSSPAPQSWQPNHIQQPLMSSTPQGLEVPSNYPQFHHFPQSQLAFDSRSPIPSDSAPFEPLPFSQDFFHSQQMTTPDTFPQQSPQHVSHAPSVPGGPYQPRTQQAPITQYTIPTGFSEGTPVNFSNGYPESATNHQTINPQFLNTPQQTANQQHASLNNDFLYMNPSDFDPSGNSKPFNYFHNDLQMSLNQPVIRNQSIPGRNTAVEMAVGGQAPALAQGSVKQPTLASQKKAKSQAKKSLSDTVDLSSDSDGYGYPNTEVRVPSPEEPSPIPPIRPIEPLDAARYDTIQAVWSPRNRRPNADKVKNALVAFKDVVKTVRDTWKENTQAMKTAENQGDNVQASQLKNAVVLQRHLMDVVVSTTLEMGHPMIVEKLGEHPMAVTAMYSFLLDRHQAADFDGALTVKILKLLSHFTTVDEDALQKTNVAKVLPRFSKKGGQIVKDLTKTIQENAASSTKRKHENAKSGSKEDSPAKSPVPDLTTANGSRSEASAGSKRPREGENNGQPAAKRMVVTSNVRNPSKLGSTTNGPAAKRPQEGGQDSKAIAATTARPKANIVAPKPTNLFGSLSSASKRPGTSNAERAAAAAATRTPNTSEKKKEAPPPPKPAFSFGDIMADLDKQKDPGPPEPAEDKPPETEEERQKRIRKEARRKLRVSWKPDHSLTEVRTFTHDPEEELGPGDRPQREAGDVKGEGRILKLHKDVDELGEEDESGTREVNLLDYPVPFETDSDLTPDDRARNYVKRGGTQEPTSPEKKVQEHRESTTLMVFYTSLADVPPSPKEPPPPSEDEIIPDEQAFGELPDHIKARQERHYSFVNPKPASVAHPNPPPGQFDISNLLKIIQSASSQQQPQPQPQAPAFPPAQPATQAPTSDLERTVNMFRQQQQQQAQVPPAVPQMPQFPVSQPQAAQGVDFQNILSVINAQKQVQQPPVLPPAPQSQPGIAPNLAAIISQLSNQNPQSPGQTYEDPERKRMREVGGLDGASDERLNQSKRTRPNNGGPTKKHPKVGIVPCRYWREGKCLKGDECTFRHDLPT